MFLETPANPTMIMTDIERAAGAAARHPDHPVVMVDNTFLGPTFQHPLMLGARSYAVLGTEVFVRLSATCWAAWRSAGEFQEMILKIRGGAQRVSQYHATRRVLDAGRAAQHGGFAHEPAE